MKTFTCAQKGDEFEADQAPSHCPVCQYPFVDASEVDEPPYLADPYKNAPNATTAPSAEAVAAQLDDDDEYLPWEAHTLPELQAIADEWGLEKFKSCTKPELIVRLAAIEAAEGEGA